MLTMIIGGDAGDTRSSPLILAQLMTNTWKIIGISEMGQSVGSSCLSFQPCANVIIEETGVSPSFPHDFMGKWPLTRAERMQELDFLSQHYNKTSQRENVDAARAWHGKFPPDEIVPDEIVTFQDGKIVKESELQPDGGAIWEEVSKFRAFLVRSPLIRAILGASFGRLHVRSSKWYLT